MMRIEWVGRYYVWDGFLFFMRMHGFGALGDK